MNATFCIPTTETGNIYTFQILWSVGDVTKDVDRKSLVERTVERFGQIDVLVG